MNESIHVGANGAKDEPFPHHYDFCCDHMSMEVNVQSDQASPPANDSLRSH